MLILPAILIFSVMLAFNLPALYAGARIAAETSAAETQAYPEVAPIRPCWLWCYFVVVYFPPG